MDQYELNQDKLQEDKKNKQLIILNFEDKQFPSLKLNLQNDDFIITPNQNVKILNDHKFQSFYYSAAAQTSNLKNIVICGGLVQKNVQSQNESYLMKVIQEKDKSYSLKCHQLPNMIEQRHCHKLINFGEKFIAIGGIQNYQDKKLEFLNSCEMFDFQEKKEWQKIAQLNKPRARFSTYHDKDFIYVYGGFCGKELHQKSFERLSLNDLKKWEIVEIVCDPQFQCWTGCLTMQINKKILIFGGSDGQKMSDQIFQLDLTQKKLGLIKKDAGFQQSNGFGLQMLDNQDDQKIVILGGNNHAYEDEILQFKIYQNRDDLSEPIFSTHNSHKLKFLDFELKGLQILPLN